MAKFDIGSLLEFEPATHLCEKCLGLMSKVPCSWKNETLLCPVCGFKYVPTDEGKSYQPAHYLSGLGYRVDVKNFIEHGRTLARIAQKVRAGDSKYPPLRGLLEALSRAQSFVHFTTYGISHLLGRVNTNH